MNRNLLVFAVLWMAATPAMAQSFDVTGPFGRTVDTTAGVAEEEEHETGEVVTTSRTARAPPPETGPQFLVVPVYVAGDGFDVASLSAVGVFGANEIELRGASIEPDEGDSLQQYLVQYKRELGRATAIFASASRTEDAFDDLALGFAAGYKFPALAAVNGQVAANLGYQRRDFEAGGSEDDFLASVAFSLRPLKKLVTSVEYVAQNKVNDDDTVSLKLTFANMLFVAADDSETYVAGLVLAF